MVSILNDTVIQINHETGNLTVNFNKGDTKKEASEKFRMLSNYCKLLDKDFRVDVDKVLTLQEANG